MLTSIAAFEISHERGFLPVHDPLTRLPKAFDAWETVALRLPKLLASDQVRRTIADLPPFPVEAINDCRERERAMVLLSYLGHAYVWGGPRPELILPARLAVPWYQIAESLGRPPVLSYSSYALHNFFRFDASREIECGNGGQGQAEDHQQRVIAAGHDAVDDEAGELHAHPLSAGRREFAARSPAHQPDWCRESRPAAPLGHSVHSRPPVY